jgi:MFS family permease
MSSATLAAPALTRHPPFLLFITGRGFSSFAYNIAAVAMGWQIYALTHSAFDLGMLGLAQFIPMAGLTFAAGHAADRYDRNRVVQICQSVEGSVAALLAWASMRGALSPADIYAAVALLGAARAFESPAVSALLPGVVPEGMVQHGTTLSSGVFQAATILGPALGGVLYALAPAAPYAVMAGFWLLACCFNGAIRLDRPVAPKEPPSLRSLFAGVGFVRRNPTILGTISLDLFAVLLGGATALLPIYARDILHTGPWGLGILRGAPAIGALLMTAYIARYSIRRRVGLRMFQAVMLFGVATLVFALSPWFLLSLAALAIMGAADMVSVVIRLSLVQVATPDDMRGRVGAVNFLFINASNQLGEFESGVSAALLGAVPAAALGGLGTILIALLWMRLFPTLRAVETLE